MTRDELIELAPRLARHALSHDEAKQLADFLRQIADAQPERWMIELRWVDRSPCGEWRGYETYATAEGASLMAARAKGRVDIAARVVPLYRIMPMED